jgi:hypothetical protein
MCDAEFEASLVESMLTTWRAVVAQQIPRGLRAS